jgi:hypothetical protein
VATSTLKSGAVLETCILMSCSALCLFQYFAFVAAYFEIALLHTHADVNGSSFFTTTLECVATLTSAQPKT